MRNSKEVEVITLEKKLLDPEFRKDAQRLEKLLADDFIEIGVSGRIWSKEDILKEFAKNSPIEILSNAFQSLELNDETLLLTYRAQTQNEGTVLSHSLRSSIWTRQGDATWVLRFHQGTRVPEHP